MVVADPEGYLLTVCENGFGKRTPFGANTVGNESADGEEAVEEAVEEPIAEGATEEEGSGERSAMHYRKQRRGGKGIRDIRTSERNGKVVGVVSVRDPDDIMLITTGGMVNRTHVREIRVVGRNTQGVRIMNLNEGDKIASIAQVAREEPEERAGPVDGPAETAPAE
jgi:DNA gyrase subunit A